MNQQKQTIINTEQCNRIGKLVAGVKFRPKFGNREFITFSTDNETKARAYIFCVAICHQTHTLQNKKLNLKGWEYLETVFLNLAKVKSKLLEPEYLTSCPKDQLISEIKAAFSEDGNPENCTLDRLDERVDLLIDMASFLVDKHCGSVIKLLENSEGLLINNGLGLYEQLGKTVTYSDSFRKKSTVFIELLENAGLIEIQDRENFLPAMDYHTQRVLLRIGCVEIIDDELKKSLQNKKTLSSDAEVRKTCIEAMQIIAKTSGYSVVKMDYLFWSLGRGCCMDKTLCFNKMCNKQPCTLTKVLDLPNHDQCIFSEICKGINDEEYRSYWQPIVDTHYY